MRLRIAITIVTMLPTLAFGSPRNSPHDCDSNQWRAEINLHNLTPKSGVIKAFTDVTNAEEFFRFNSIRTQGKPGLLLYISYVPDKYGQPANGAAEAARDALFENLLS